GSADNKGQHFAHIMAIQFLYENYREIFDSVNIKLILDGDEELGSPTMRPFVLNHKDLLAADFILISDGPSLDKNGPTLVGSVRGIVSFQITISHNQSDLHSGNFGGVARSATLDLKNLLDSMVDTEGYVTIEGFYNDIEDQSELEKSALVDLESIYDDNIASYGITRAIRTKGHSNPFLNQAWPTLNINGLSAGGVGNKRRTIIPQKAIASIDCRLVYAQDPERVMGLIKKHISTWAEVQGIQSAIELETENFMAPPPSSLSSEYIHLVKTAIAKGFQKEPKLVPRLGGSLPTSLFPEILGKPAILFPISLPDSRNHGPNENLDIEFLEFGIVSSVFILVDFAKDTNR
ncbi:MAG: M20/M25/M40 family metallo-hydrolase, partial [Candidatus Heimdallarchaeota archaeon]|nr:M20/M25/M40 family metallo-hydrolase [Candidatus Heimdallarchaeota archaeon]